MSLTFDAVTTEDVDNTVNGPSNESKACWKHEIPVKII